MKCLPTDIVGPKTDLEVDISKQPRVLHWPDKFCQGLLHLIPHPMFQGNPTLLATALQYAVICATDDRRHWALQNTCSDGFLGALIKTIDKKQDGTIPYKDIHNTARRRFAKKFPQGTPGFWSQLFLSIELVADKTRAVRRAVPEGAYKITYHDLRNVAEALDNMTFGALTVFHPTELVSAVFQSARTQSDLPLDTDGGLEKDGDGQSRGSIADDESLPTSHSSQEDDEMSDDGEPGPSATAQKRSYGNAADDGSGSDSDSGPGSKRPRRSGSASPSCGDSY